MTSFAEVVSFADDSSFADGARYAGYAGYAGCVDRCSIESSAIALSARVQVESIIGA